MDLGQLCKPLRVALEAHAEIELALLFGSRARDEAGPDSDVDVALVGHNIDTIGLGIELTDAVCRLTSWICLAIPQLPSSSIEVLRDGIRVYETAGSYGRFLARTLTKLDLDLPALRRMQHAFVHRVVEHGLADAPSNVAGDIVQNKVARLTQHVERVRAHRRATATELVSQPDAFELVAYNLVLVVQLTCDLAVDLIAGQGLGSAPDRRRAVSSSGRAPYHLAKYGSVIATSCRSPGFDHDRRLAG